MDFHTAMKDLKTRIANYEAVYEELDEAETDSTGKSISFIKVIRWAFLLDSMSTVC